MRSRSRAPRISRMKRIVFAALALLAGSCGVAAPAIVDYTVQLDVIREGYDGVHCWVHPRAGIVPNGAGAVPSVVLTLQTLWLKGSDVFGPLNELRTDDLGRTWTGPIERSGGTTSRGPALVKLAL